MTDSNQTDLQHKPDISKSNACPPLPDNVSKLDKLMYWLGIGLGSGLPKKAPGTWGTVGGMLVGVPMMMLGFYPFLIITIIASVVGIWICDRTSKLMGVHDDPHIVWDEWAGIWIAMLPIHIPLSVTVFGRVVPPESMLMPHQWLSLELIILAFILFRFFDILKPFPIGYLDKKLDGGFGIMLDDILAGIFTCIIVTLVPIFIY